MTPLRLAAGLAALSLGGGCALHAQAGPVGTFRARTITVELTQQGRATFSNPRAVMIEAVFLVRGDSIEFRDEGGPAACPGESGRYLWRLDGDTLRFRLLSDPCDGRKAAFAMAWLRVVPATVLTGVTIIDGTGAAPRASMTIVMRDGLIADLHPDGARPIPQGADVHDGSGQWAIPGLIDAHVHVATDPTGPDRRDRVERRLRNAVRGGVMAVRDMGGDARVLADLARAAATGQIESPVIRYSAIMAGPEFFDDPRVRASSAAVPMGTAPWARAVTDATDYAQVVAEARGSGATGIKLYADLDSTRIARLAREARRQGVAVWAHAAMALATPSAIAAAGVAVMSHAVLLTREVTPPTAPGSGRVPFDYSVGPADPGIALAIASIARNGVIFEPTMFVFRAPPGSPDTSLARRREQRAGEFTHALRRAGVRIVAGTDGLGGDANGDMPNLHEELALLVERGGLTPMEALVSATSTGAEVLGLPETRGTIAIGKAADVVVLRADPVLDIRNTRAIATVFQRGRPVR
jgi:imidazolonepropionase-like amidohydrolase